MRVGESPIRIPGHNPISGEFGAIESLLKLLRSKIVETFCGLYLQVWIRYLHIVGSNGKAYGKSGNMRALYYERLRVGVWNSKR